MKHKTKLILVFIFSLFLSLASGCGFMVIEVTPTPTPQTPIGTPSPANISTSIPAPSKLPFPATKYTPDVPISVDGPWLVYERSYVDDEFIIMNQDGSGKKIIEPFPCDVTDFLMNEEGAATYMVEMGWYSTYLFRPEQASGCFAPRDFNYWDSDITFSRREKGGLLAGIPQSEEDESPELIVYELPAGTIRARLPLIQCPEEEKACLDGLSGDFWSGLLGYISGQQFRWSPDGRYLAFTAIRNSISSDLYVLDSQDGSLRQLTSGPDWVGGIWWSPDGSQILMEEIVMPWKNEQDRKDRFYISLTIPSSLWLVSVSDSQLRPLYSIEEGGGCCSYRSAYHYDGPLWLDDKRFLIYEGAAGDVDLAKNLRLVDTSSSETRMIVDFSFWDIAWDEVHETLAVLLPYWIEEYDEQGVYLVSIKNSAVLYLDICENMSFLDWDEETGLFVSDCPCEDDPEKVRAFNYLGEFSCVSKPLGWEPLATTAYPAPDGKSEVSVQEGLWLKAEGQEAIQVSQETASNVIWCPDSSCFFFFVKQAYRASHLYHVSLPDLTIKLVDEGIQNAGNYQWLQKDDDQP
jgi:hypothetical protein